MNKHIFHLAFCVLFATLSCYCETLTGLVVGVTDGDTVRLLDASKKQHRIRLNGIDAPESHQAFGQRSRQLLSDLVFQKNIRVEYKETDMYGRILGTIFLGEDNINLKMVQSGMAWHYVYYAKNDKALADAQAAAKQKKIGLWTDPNPIPPWNFRRQKKKAK